MLDFAKEVQKFRPSTDVSSVEEALVNADLTDMNDIVSDILREAAESSIE